MSDRIFKHVTKMTDEERDVLFRGCERSRISFEECKKNNLYDFKRDRCKEMREQKEREEKERINKIVELEKEFDDYKSQTEERFNRLADLLSNLSK